MAFDNINFTNDHDFGKYLNKFVTPSVPVTTPDQRIGRSEKLTSARRALLDIGKQIFIIGNRGVGKTSLANVIASFYQSSDTEPSKPTVPKTQLIKL